MYRIVEYTSADTSEDGFERIVIKAHGKEVTYRRNPSTTVDVDDTREQIVAWERLDGDQWVPDVYHTPALDSALNALSGQHAFGDV